MPIYDFECPECGEEQEVLAKHDAEVVCKCGAEMKKLIRPFGAYYIKGDNSASVRPKTAGYRTVKKND